MRKGSASKLQEQLADSSKTSKGRDTRRRSKASNNAGVYSSRQLENQTSEDDEDVKAEKIKGSKYKAPTMLAKKREGPVLESQVDPRHENLQKRRRIADTKEKQTSSQKILTRTSSRKRESSELGPRVTRRKAKLGVSKTDEVNSFSEADACQPGTDKTSRLQNFDKLIDARKLLRKSIPQQLKEPAEKAEPQKQKTGRRKSIIQIKDNRKQQTGSGMHQNRGTRDASPTRDDQNVQIVTEESTSDSDFEAVSANYRTPKTSPSSQTSLSNSANISRNLESSFSEVETSPVGLGKEQNSSKKVPEEGDSSKDKIPAETKKGSEKSSKQRKQSSKRGTRAKAARDGIKNTTGKEGKMEKLSSAVSPKEFRPTALLSVDEMDVTAVLLKMEGQTVVGNLTDCHTPSTSGAADGRVKQKLVEGNLMSGSESGEESDWEEVEEFKHSPVKSQIPEAPVEITINDPNMLHKKRQKKKFDWREYVKRRIKRLARETQVQMHKVHLLCLLSRGMLQNSACNDQEAHAFALSLIPGDDLGISVSKHTTESLLGLVKWFKTSFSLISCGTSLQRSLISPNALSSAFAKKTAEETRMFVMMMIVLLRVMGFNVRLVVSLQPLPLKISMASSTKETQKKEKESKITENSGKTESKSLEMLSARKIKTVRKKVGPAKRPKGESKKQRPSTKKLKRPELQSSSSSSDDDEGDDNPGARVRRQSVRSKVVAQKMPSSAAKGEESDNDFVPGTSNDEGSNFSEEELVVRKKMKVNKRKSVKDKKSKKNKLSEGSEEEFEEVPLFTTPDIKKEGKSKKPNRKVLSSSSDSNSPAALSTKTTGKGQDYWLEVYLPKEKRWICVDCIKCMLDKPFDISSTATQPLLYVLAFDNKSHVKDITAKYAPHWLTQTRKKRVDTEWWRETLDLYATTSRRLDDKEDQEIAAALMKNPLPTSIGEYKNHPLYVLPRHLLKFEAIYPESSVPVGYIRQEPVYARECVHVLHSRENWLKEGRSVQLGETAYKRVKSRKRWKKDRESSELDLELFGRWQTEKYVPPPAVDGKVPKNEYGNVELFQPWMLPGGTVHVRVPALNRVAKKLGIDVAPAMVGWDHHCGYSHPVLDGWIVCKEHKKILLAAWKEDQKIQEEREAERREKRVLTNWANLARGLLIKDRLKKKFNLMDKSAELEKLKKSSTKGTEVATDVQHAWPAKQQQKQKKQVAEKDPRASHFSVEIM